MRGWACCGEEVLKGISVIINRRFCIFHIGRCSQGFHLHTCDEVLSSYFHHLNECHSTIK